MWTLDNLPLAAIEKQYGQAPSPALISQMMKASVQVDGGCSGSFVSPSGLVLTNHHCVVSCVQELSTPRSDLVKDGFLAKSPAHERRCPAFEVSRLEQITDVTAQVHAATQGKTGAEFAQAMNQVRAQITGACQGSAGEEVRCDLVTLYHGGRYALHRFHRYTDVRLVWAPEDAIAAFGGDPDNFNFPRYDLDAGLLRAYENGKPAATPDFLAFQPQGPKAGEVSYIIGNPGRTERLLTLAQLEEKRDYAALRGFPDRHEFRGLLIQYGKTSREAARLADDPLRWVENGLKVARGQLETLLNPDVMQTKREQEQQLRRYYSANLPADHATLGDPWLAIEKAMRTKRELAAEYALIEQGRGFNARQYAIARTLVRGAIERAKPETERLPEFSSAALVRAESELASRAPIPPALTQASLAWSLHKMRDTLGPDHPVVKQVLSRETPDDVARRMVQSSRLTEPAERLRLWRGGQAAIEASRDPFIVLARQLEAPSRELATRWRNEVEAVERLHARRIAQVRFARDGASVYPDATGTLRLTYGELKGWQEASRTVDSGTDFAGLYRRATGAAPFALPPSWLGKQGVLNPKQRFNFVSTHDITGGNSGSPVINAKGELIGLAFDGNLHSIGGDIAYDERTNRTVSVDAGAIVEALRAIYKADHLVQELTTR